MQEKAKAEWKNEATDFARVANVAKQLQRGRPAADKKAAPMAQQEEAQGAFANDAIGLGGGGGGRFGGRHGGRKVQTIGQPQSGWQASLGKDAMPDSPKLGLFFSSNADGDVRARTENFFGQQMEVTGGLSYGYATDGVDRQLATELERLRAAVHAGVVWLPAVTTGEDGRARIEVAMPQRSAKWRLRVQGVGKSNLFGEARAELDDGEGGPRPRRPADRLDRGGSRRGAHRPAQSRCAAARGRMWSLRAGARRSSRRARPRSPARGTSSARPSLEAEERWQERDAAHRRGAVTTRTRRLQSFEVLPWGIEERVVQSGRLAGRIDVPLQLPDGAYRSRELVIEVGPNTPEDLFPFGGLRSRAQLSLNRSHYVAPTVGNRAAMGLAALVLHARLRRGRAGREGAHPAPTGSGRRSHRESPLRGERTASSTGSVACAAARRSRPRATSSRRSS